MSCSQFESYLSKAAVDRVDDVEDPVLSVARGEQDWAKRYEFLSHCDKGFSNFDFKKEKFGMKGE